MTVADTGIGISADQLPNIYDRFYQADGSLTRRYSGIGLGLAIAREIVLAHGGEITVASTPNAGTTFTLRLPAWVAP
ncbi:MAG TPA: ATP-binding protein, partial [bacterium]|nr:ATP-binding protein [bacterium]